MEAVGRAIRDYELTAMSGLGLPVGFEKTGGEPLAYEQAALNSLIAKTYPELRRLDSEVLRRVAAMSNRADLVGVESRVVRWMEPTMRGEGRVARSREREWI